MYIDEVHTPALNLVPRSKYSYVEIYGKQKKLYSRTKNVGKDVITNHHTDREKEPAKWLFHKTLMRRLRKKSDSAVKRQNLIN